MKKQVDLLGFKLDLADDNGNTLLLVCAQNNNSGLVKFLLGREGVNINHQNGGGNTALHFAMAYDNSGKMGEMLIKEGADDMLENKKGLSPYDGLD